MSRPRGSGGPKRPVKDPLSELAGGPAGRHGGRHPDSRTEGARPCSATAPGRNHHAQRHHPHARSPVPGV